VTHWLLFCLVVFAMNERKGKEIRFRKGKYIGKTGWIDNDRVATAKSYPVIVHNVNNSKGIAVDIGTTVRKSSVVFYEHESGKPMSYFAAVCQQHPKIEQNMEKLCKQLAMCEVSAVDNDMLKMFVQKMEEASMAQIEKGSDALWYQIDYNNQEKAEPVI